MFLCKHTYDYLFLFFIFIYLVATVGPCFGTQASPFVALGLSCPAIHGILVPQPVSDFHSPCTRSQILKHWSTREVLTYGYLDGWFLTWIYYPFYSRDVRKMGVHLVIYGLPCGSAGKESTCNVGDLGSIPGLGRSPGEGKGYPLQYSGLENSMDCVVHGVAESEMTEWLSLHFYFSYLSLFTCLLRSHGGKKYENTSISDTRKFLLSTFQCMQTWHI